MVVRYNVLIVVEMSLSDILIKCTTAIRIKSGMFNIRDLGVLKLSERQGGEYEMGDIMSSKGGHDIDQNRSSNVINQRKCKLYRRADIIRISKLA
jgi:hypothetical protein